ncbi:MAG: hypothetical protein E3J90_04955 [Promethearchaeota archaeon]|nr:MAG: hypothetical protein E3J90_04955 [Candidatus Lokiarchaeota archaeon]
MNKIVENNVEYYEFLSVIHEISKKSQSIQKDSIRKVYQNYDLRIYRIKLEKEIAELIKLIMK